MTAPKGRKAKKAKPGQNKQTVEHRYDLFVDAFLSNNGNATQAALAAGFSPKSAACQGSRLLKNVKIQQALDKRRAQVAERIGLTTERTLLEVARLAYADPRKLFHPDGRLKAIHELDDDTAATVASIEVDEMTSEGAVVGLTKKIKHWDKNAALEKAMKFHGLYEKDNAQPNAALAEAVMNSGLAPLAAKFAQVLGR